MTKTPPHRRGITFEVGEQLEARDSLKNWYAANIEKIDYEDEKVLIHYRQWSHRYDEWFDWNSPYLRPMERVRLRRQGLQENRQGMGFQVNQKVLASWSDCRYYPAKVRSVNKDGSYTVKFFDGVVKTVKGIKVKPFQKERNSGRSGQQGRRREPNGKDWRPKPNGSGRMNGSRHSISDHDGESEMDDDEEDVKRMKDDGIELLNGTQKKEAEKLSNGDEEMRLDGKAEGQDPEEKMAVVNGDGLHTESPQEKSKRQRGSEKTPEEEEKEKEEMNEETSGENPGLAKRTRRSLTEDRSSRAQKQARSESVPAGSEVISKEHKGLVSPSEIPKPEAGAVPAPDLATLVRQQIHLPATNKYSREPLYRVIKNQPPPILSIELDHNPFKCKVAGCLKSFRKASLLHYHMKYYHAESELSPQRSIQTRASEKQAVGMETPRRRRTVSLHSPLSDSKSGHPLSPPVANGEHRQRLPNSEKSKENQQMNRKSTDDPDGKAMEIGEHEKERLREKRQKDFLRIKLKKKKKRKKKMMRSKSDYSSSEENIGLNAPHCTLNLALKLPLSHKHNNSEPHTQTMLNGEDSASEWSTDSPTWSEDELEAELDLTTPLAEQGVAVEPHGAEIVRCVCEVQEENDFMIQCEECFCWQHGTCMGLMEDSVPDTYSCYICRDPPAQRQSRRYWYDRDWLNSGQMYGLSFLGENYSHQNGRKITATHQLLGDVQRVFEVLSGLQLKMSILQAQAHPDLKLWRQPWKQAEHSKRKAGPSEPESAAPSPSPSSTDPYIRTSADPESHGRWEASSQDKPGRVASFQDSYISSEHCYQKPRTYYPAVEQRLVVETRGGSELEDSLRSTEDLLEMEQRYAGEALGRDWSKTQMAISVKEEDDSNAKELEWSKMLQNGEVERGGEPDVKVEDLEDNVDPDPDLVLQQQWQLNLLDHIDAVQDEVTHRMELIERELDVLESWLDYTGELEPPDPLARLPQLKHRIKELLTDLGTVQQIAVCSSST
ncbi:PHD finger protein 20b isoform X2 [Clupea harengus]|uniref:PHD finger protein 20b isoform X2 n=1 Tax=Clupea harengus TaxID=7950 RepID=A0A6P8FGQ6_CLUHA|nr:PHD finger protein 20b isoform X2 [Clupea harengus]